MQKTLSTSQQPPVSPVLGEVTYMPATIQARDWMIQLTKRGVFPLDTRGKATLDPQVRLLVDALHTVLAGGQVDVRVLRTGAQSVKAALDESFDGACEATLRLRETTEEPLAP